MSRGAIRRVAAATGALVVALGIRPIAVDRILGAYVLVLAAIALAALTQSTRRPSPASAFEAALRPATADIARPTELVRIEREITLGTASAGHLHQRLLPLLREAAAVRLAATRRIDLDRQPEAARALLGDDAWELLRPDRPAPANPRDPGASLRRVREVVDVLERLE